MNNLESIYRRGTAYLEKSGVPEPELDAWYLLEYVTGISRAAYFADPKREMDQETVTRVWNLFEKRAERIPLQHLTGVQEFMGLEFQVDENVLIPRQDTEVLVEAALAILKKHKIADVLDLCTGSGCILLSILHYGKKNKGTGADISAAALEIAKKNAQNLSIEADFIESDLFTNIHKKYDMIVSNPPYIPSSHIEKLQKEVKEHDPILALDGGADGMDFYRKIIHESVQYLNIGGWLLFEIGSEQGEDISNLMKAAGFSKVAVKKDLAGLDRVVSGVYDI